MIQHSRGVPLAYVQHNKHTGNKLEALLKCIIVALVVMPWLVYSPFLIEYLRLRGGMYGRELGAQGGRSLLRTSRTDEALLQMSLPGLSRKEGSSIERSAHLQSIETTKFDDKEPSSQRGFQADEGGRSGASIRASPMEIQEGY